MQSEDPYYFFYTHYVSDGEIQKLFLEAVKDGFRLGHTNPIGSIFFHFYFFVIHDLAGLFNAKPWLISGILRSSLILVLLGVVYEYLKTVLKIEFKYMHYFVWATTIYFGTIQFHSPWAHDFSASGPVQGILTPILMLSNIILTTKLIQNNFKKGSMIMILFTICCLHVYELQLINLIYLPLMLIREKKIDYKKKFFYFSKFCVFPFLVWLFGKLFLSENSAQYSGTMLSTPSTALKTTSLNLLGTIPTSAWNLTSRLIPEAFDLVNNFLILIVLLGILFFQVLLYKNYSIKIEVDSKFKLNLVFLIILVILSSTMHGITIKNSQDVSVLGHVYFSYGVGFVVWFIFIILMMLKLSTMKLRVKLPIFMLLISFFAIQVNINYSISSRQVSDYQSLEKVINSSIWIPKSEIERCEILTEWQPVYTDSYYSNAIVNGLNYFTQKEFNSDYCSKYQIEQD
jgi:hypothetical protein